MAEGVVSLIVVRLTLNRCLLYIIHHFDLIFRLSPTRELDARLEAIAHDLGSTKSDVLRRALALTEEVHEARKQNKIVGVLTQDHELETEFIGI